VATVSGGLASKSVAAVFSGLASKPVATVFSSLGSKLVATVSPGLTSKPAVGFLGSASKPRWWRVSQFRPQNQWLRFGDLCLKITAVVSWFVLQNQSGFGLSVAPQNRWRKVDVGHTSRSSCLLHVEASLARVSQSGLNTVGGVMTGGARVTITEVVSEAS
jgi:hypothetical protein